MQYFIVHGGYPLKGEVKLCGAKNSGFKLMIASLYSDKETTIRNFSKIGDIWTTAQIIEELGGKVIFENNHLLKVTGKGLFKQEFSEDKGKLSRASTYFLGPLLYRFGRALLPVPGGCKIGRRPLDRHLEGIKALGAKVETKGDYYLITAKKLKGATYRFPKNTHGGTDVMIIAACSAEGETILENAAQEPEIDDLIKFLNQMGAKIKRIKPRTILIKGVKKFKPTDFSVMPDRNEAVTFACAALATKGDVFIQKADPKVLGAFLDQLKKIGGGYQLGKKGIRFFYKKPLKACNVLTRPYPGFMTDWMGVWVVLLTQARGWSVVHETIFENRFAFVEELKKMGAKIELFNPRVPDPDAVYNFNLEDDRPEYFHAAKIYGPVKLKASKVNVTDLRAGATLILASLIAEGESEIAGGELIDRGYERIDERLKQLGAHIERINR